VPALVVDPLGFRTVAVADKPRPKGRYGIPRFTGRHTG